MLSNKNVSICLIINRSFIRYCSGLRRLFSLTSLRSFSSWHLGHSNSFEWPRRQEEGEAKLFEIVSPEFGRCPFLQDFRSERQPVVLRFAEPPALSPWRSAPRGEGDRPNLKFRCGPSFRTNCIPEPEVCRLPWFSSLFRLFGSFFEKKERLPQKPKQYG